MSTPTTIISSAVLIRRLTKLEASVQRLILTMTENRRTAAADDDDWRRIPSHPARCQISGWARTTLWRHVKSGIVRSRIVNGSRFYCGADVRRMISQPKTENTP